MRNFLYLFPVLCLAACASDKAVFSCPETGLMREAQHAAFFARAAENPTKEDVAVYAELKHPKGECKLKSDGKLDIEMSLAFVAQKVDTSATQEKQNLSYFIAVLDPEENILQRQNFYTSVMFEKDAIIGTSIEEHGLYIPVPEASMAGKYKVVAGFALTPEQLKFNEENK